MGARHHLRLLLFALLALMPGPAAPSQDVPVLTPDERNTIEVFRRSSPAVVHINAQQKVTFTVYRNGQYVSVQFVLQPMH